MPDDTGGQGGTPAPAPTPVPASTPAPADETPFYEGFSDTEIKSWVEAKGWKSAEALAKSALNLERMIGAPPEQIVRIPQSEDPAALRPVFERLGMPAKPEDYEIPQGEGSIPEYEQEARQTYHKLGLTKSQAKALTEFNQEFAKKYEASQNETRALESTTADTELKREWGNAYPRQMNAAQRAAQQLGFTEDMVAGLENAVGYKDTMKFLAQLGGKLGEDNLVSGDGRPGFGGTMTPAQAQQAWAAFSSDPGNREALFNRMHPGHAEALKRKTELFQVMHPNE